MIVDRLREAAEAQDKATKGPWMVHEDCGQDVICMAPGDGDYLLAVAVDISIHANAIFIAKVRSVPLKALADLAEATRWARECQTVNPIITDIMWNKGTITDDGLDEIDLIQEAAEDAVDKALAVLEDSNA